MLWYLFEKTCCVKKSNKGVNLTHIVAELKVILLNIRQLQT